MNKSQIEFQLKVLRELVEANYERHEWLYLPGPRDPGLQKLNIMLAELVSGTGKRTRLNVLEVVSILMGWHNGTSAEAIWADYEQFKKSLGRGKGNADRAYQYARDTAKKCWRLGSTKDLNMAQIYGLLSWLDENGQAQEVVKTIHAAPAKWQNALLSLSLHPVYRPVCNSGYPPVEEEEVEQLPIFDLGLVEQDEDCVEEEEYVPF